MLVETGQITKLSKKEIKFSYRKTSINDDSIITCAKFKVILNDKEEIFKKIKKVSKERISSQPINLRTGGSTFKNPPNESAWKLYR